MQNFKLPLRPGSMRTDINKNDIGESIHYLVQNLRQVRKNEWENARGYLTEISGQTNVRTAIEVTDDLSGDRFLLIQIGTTLYRIDYDSGYDIADATALTLPTGVEIPSSTTVRFFYFRGIVRITGPQLTASPYTKTPLWYGYINRVIERYGITDFEHSGWFLEKATPDINVNPTNVTPMKSFFVTNGSGSALAANEFKVLYIKAFYISDEGQFSLLKDITSMSNFIVNTSNYTTLGHGVNFELSIQYSSTDCFSGFPRLTGIGIAIGYKKSNESDDTEITNWKVADIVDFTDQDWRNISWVDGFYNESYTPNYDSGYDVTKVVYTHGLLDTDENRAKLMFLQSHFKSGWPVKISGPNGTVLTSVDANECQFVDLGSSVILEIYLNDDVTSAFDSTTDLHVQIDFSFPKVRFYGSTFRYLAVLDLVNYIGTDLNTYRDFPAGTTEIDLQYSHNVVINDIAYALSLESDEVDIVRYSPQGQFDVFPQLNLIQSPSGDFDNNKAIVERDGRFMIMKNQSISQGHKISNDYYYDKSGKKRGLYADDGYIVIDDILYFMGKDDIYRFAGNVIQGWLENEFLRSLYRTYISKSSFFGHNPEDKELWIFLNGYILVWHYEFNEWYYRKTGITPVAAFIDSDNIFRVVHTTGVAIINHNTTPYSESIEAKFQTGYIDTKMPEFFKKLRKIYARAKGNVALTLAATDPNESISYSEAKSLDASNITTVLYKPALHHHELTITGTFGSSTNPGILMKSFDIIIGAWRRG